MPSASAIRRLATRVAGLLDEPVEEAVKVTPKKKASNDPKAPAVVTRGFEPWDSRLYSREELQRLPERPDVPQFDLERYNPKRGASPRAQDLANNRKAWNQYNKLVDRGTQMGAHAWYNAEPLRRDFIEMHGPEVGDKFFQDYMRMVAASSTGSAVPANARNASYYFVNQGNLPKATPLPQPYGHKMQQNHLRQALDAEAGRPWDVFTNPKPASFNQNLVGNWRPATVDKHSTRGPAMLSGDPRWLLTRHSEDATRRPQDMHAAGVPLSQFGPMDFADVPNANEYGLLEDVFQHQAGKMGLDPAQYQAAGWIGGGELTGLGSPPLPFLQVLEQRVLHTAQKRGETPSKVYQDFLARKAPLLGGAPVAIEGQLGLFDDPEEN